METGRKGSGNKGKWKFKSLLFIYGMFAINSTHILKYKSSYTNVQFHSSLIFITVHLHLFELIQALS